MTINSEIINIKTEFNKSYSKYKKSIRYFDYPQHLTDMLDDMTIDDLSFMLDNEDINIDIMMFKALLMRQDVNRFKSIVDIIVQRINENVDYVEQAVLNNTIHWTIIGRNINLTFWEPIFKKMFETHQRALINKYTYTTISHVC